MNSSKLNKNLIEPFGTYFNQDSIFDYEMEEIVFDEHKSATFNPFDSESKSTLRNKYLTCLESGKSLLNESNYINSYNAFREANNLKNSYETLYLMAFSLLLFYLESKDTLKLDEQKLHLNKIIHYTTLCIGDGKILEKCLAIRGQAHIENSNWFNGTEDIMQLADFSFEQKDFVQADMWYDFLLSKGCTIGLDFFRMAYSKEVTHSWTPELGKDLIKYYKESLKFYPDNYSTYNNIGVQFQKLEKYDQALTYYKKAYSLNRNEPMYAANIGLAYYAKSDFSQALDFFLHAETLGYKVNKFKLATCYMTIGKNSESLAFYEAYTKEDPRNSTAYFNMANMYYEGNQLEKSLSNYARAESLGYDEDAFYLNYANALFDSRHFEKAKHFFELAEQRNCYIADHKLALCYEKLGFYNKAIDVYKESEVAHNDNTPITEQRLGDLCALDGRKGEAIQHYLEAAKAGNSEKLETALDLAMETKDFSAIDEICCDYNVDYWKKVMQHYIGDDNRFDQEIDDFYSSNDENVKKLFNM